MNNADIRFEIEINGQKIGISSVESCAVLCTTLSYAKRDPDRYEEVKQSAPENWSTTPEEWERESIELSSTSLKDHQSTHWLREDLNVGDEIKIRILGPGKVDPPRNR